MRVEDDITVYNACVVICNWRYTTFQKVSPQGKNSMDRIRAAGMKMSVGYYDKFSKKIIYSDPKNNSFDINTNCIPIRISSEDEVNMICSDWCTSGSPIKSLNYDSIPRWWPAEWLYKNPGEIPDYIKIDLGTLSKTQHIVLECKVVKKPNSEIMCTAFSDIFIEGVDDLNITSDRQLNNDDDKNDDIECYDVVKADGDMLFGKKKESKPTVVKMEEPPRQEEISSNINNDIEEENIMSGETEAVVSNNNEQKEAEKVERKKVPTWVKVTGGVIIASAVIGGGIYAYNKFVKGKDNTPTA